MSKERIVVVAVDASEHSMNCFSTYMKEIYRKNDTTVICHIPEVQNFNAISFKRWSLKNGLNIPIEDWKKAMEEQVRKVSIIENKYESELASRKIPYKMRIEYNKSPGHGIVSVAENEKASMIVMGAKGTDTIRRTFLGSVTDYVVHHSKVPVCVCPNKEP